MNTAIAVKIMLELMLMDVLPINKQKKKASRIKRQERPVVLKGRTSRDRNSRERQNGSIR
jgi:hypothetical protein